MQIATIIKSAAVAASLLTGGVIATTSASAEVYLTGQSYYGAPAPYAGYYGSPYYNNGPVGSPEAAGPATTYGYAPVVVAPGYAYGDDYYYGRGNGRRGYGGYISEDSGSLSGRVDQP